MCLVGYMAVFWFLEFLAERFGAAPRDQAADSVGGTVKCLWGRRSDRSQCQVVVQSVLTVLTSLSCPVWRPGSEIIITHCVTTSDVSNHILMLPRDTTLRTIVAHPITYE